VITRVSLVPISPIELFVKPTILWVVFTLTAYSNNFASFGNGGGALDFMEQSHEAMTPALEAFEDMMDILRLPK